MADDPEKSKEYIENSPSEYVEEGFVQLPFNEAQFKEFIRSLLGSPQAISKRFYGPFEIEKVDVSHLYHLISQRITQQNAGHLLQFTATIHFSDNTTVELKSLDDFMAYNVVSPIVSRAVHLSWDYAVTFPEAQSIEKQNIQISFDTTDAVYDHGSMSPFANPGNEGTISFRIEHTARSWGVDMEGLLTDFIDGIIDKPAGVREFFSNHEYRIIGGLRILLFIAIIIGFGLSFIRLEHRYTAELNSIIDNNRVVDILSFDQKIDKIRQFNNDFGLVYQFIGLLFLAATSIGIVQFGLDRIKWLIDEPLPSFVLLSSESIKERVKVLKRLERNWLKFGLGIIGSIIVGILTNYLYTIWFP